VAAFAAGAFGRLVSAGDAFVMRILVEVKPEVRVTSLTDGAAGIVIGREQGKAHAEQEQPSGHVFNIEEESVNNCKFLRR
jgi:2-methylcitrate dehydratase PrpD